MSTQAAAPVSENAVETPMLDNLIEGMAWVVLGLVPLLINVYNVDAYRTIQATYSTVFLTLIAAVWGVSVTMMGRWGELRRFPFLLAIGGFIAWSLASFVFRTPSLPTSMASWINLVLYALFFVAISDLAARK
ncbi:MAG: hypothetical protein KGR26_14620, partial [Cyanobacteria bacterium REEB65]|nr:hypothetical protein [Cyanobacteria bacterium REEB65]